MILEPRCNSLSLFLPDDGDDEDDDGSIKCFSTSNVSLIKRVLLFLCQDGKTFHYVYMQSWTTLGSKTLECMEQIVTGGFGF